MRWSLNELYDSFESEAYTTDSRRILEMISEVNTFAEKELTSTEGAKEKAEKYLRYDETLTKLISKVLSYASLTMAVDARNEVAKENYARIAMSLSELTKAEVLFTRFIAAIENLQEVMDSSDYLKEHEFMLKEIRKNARYLLSNEEEMLISKMSNTGSKAWTNLQNILTSTLLVDIELEGEKKKLPLPAIRNLAYDKDPDVRKKAFEAELSAYEKVEESSAAALNGIKGEVLTVSELRGFSHPLEETLLQSRMEKETLDAMFTAIKESLPMFRKYLKRKAALLGHEKGLPFYDLFAPMGESQLHFTYEEAMDYIVKNFNTFSTRLGDYARNAYEKNWMDVEPRDGKRGGAFCSNLHAIGESRVMANFDGSFSNMTTLAHELGHGYHGYNLKDETILNSSYPMPIAETASIFCETIVVNAALKEMDDREAVTILEQSISDATQVIVDIYSRYLFETKLFETRKDHPLSVKELKSYMVEAQKEAYGEGLDEDVLHPYMWLNKTHYYSAGRNFYNFPYAFGLLFSKGLYAVYLKRGEEFVPEYDALLSVTGKKDIIEVAEMMNIDVTKPDFFRDSLKIVEKDIEKFLSLTKK
ncbi:M3 family oligoendopeptidase [Proteiniclasticum sp. SCR006]|uniref:M3 family oligoendopeptidase n=1 Tax=Proteiniclasticum aestuarii TaxID=2817862 RepID=A0A939H636_9CLOT|nr:M3 family oligoendopeptidase [Proteiniclasticum aestuarii]MBO1264932.1 M3 family oligoendopeptidase [Proteiniclasticum aestuarii]